MTATRTLKARLNGQPAEVIDVRLETDEDTGDTRIFVNDVEVSRLSLFPGDDVGVVDFLTTPIGEEP